MRFRLRVAKVMADADGCVSARHVPAQLSLPELGS
jgi:hypothetical protein